MEQRSVWEHFPRKEIARTKTREPLQTNHSCKIHNHSTPWGEWTQKAARRKTQEGINPVEIEIIGSMAQRGREKHQILPPFHDPQMPHQSHHKVGWITRQHPINSSGNNARADRFLQGSPLKTQCGLYLSNIAGDPKYPKYNHPRT